MPVARQLIACGRLKPVGQSQDTFVLRVARQLIACGRLKQGSVRENDRAEIGRKTTNRLRAIETVVVCAAAVVGAAGRKTTNRLRAIETISAPLGGGADGF